MNYSLIIGLLIIVLIGQSLSALVVILVIKSLLLKNEERALQTLEGNTLVLNRLMEYMTTRVPGGDSGNYAALTRKQTPDDRQRETTRMEIQA